MGLRFFADQCVPSSIDKTLQEAGHEVLRLRDYLPIDSSDAAVIAKAQELDAVLVSLDGDFADIVAYPPASYKGIVALRARNHPEVIPQLMERLKAYLSAYPEMHHYAGKLFLVEPHIIGVRE